MLEMTQDNEAGSRVVHGREGLGINRRMKSGIKVCCDTSVRRQERDYEATNLSRDEFPASVPNREWRVVDEGAPCFME